MLHSNRNIRQWSLFLTWLIALAALLVAQYSSHILNYSVCELCWYQRVCIYPLVIMIGIATFRNDAGIAIYAIPLTILGAIFALLQYLEQIVPDRSILICQKGQGQNCSLIHIKFFGFITFPFLSILACIMMTILLFIIHQTTTTKNRKESV